MATFALLDLGTSDLVIILLIVLLLFGGKKLPELAGSLGKSAKELKKGLGDVHDLRDEAKTQINQVKQSWHEGEAKPDETRSEPKVS